MFSFLRGPGKIKQTVNERAMTEIRRVVESSRNGDLKVRANVDMPLMAI